MLLKKLTIENFRGIASLELDLDPITVLIGENNTGKTSVLEAVHICLARALSRRSAAFDEYDFHVASAGSAIPAPIQVTLRFEENTVDEWPDELVQAFSNVIQTLAGGQQAIIFRVKITLEPVTKDITLEWMFLDLVGNTLITARQPKLLSDLQLFTPAFLLTAVRDAAQQFNARSVFWAPFTKTSAVDDQTRQQIETQIEQLNQMVLDSHEPFEQIKEKLTQIATLLPMGSGDIVSVEAVPARILEVLAKTQIKLEGRTGLRLPIGQHGAGAQSLAVFFLFEAFLASRLEAEYVKTSEPIVALEEPESHLHPSAIHGLWSVLSQFRGQKLVATHSGDLLASVPLDAIRRLGRQNGTLKAFRVAASTLTARERQKIAYHVRAKRGALLFARCWLLVEGETDFTIVPEVARLLGSDFGATGIACVEFAQCGLDPLIKLARDLGIEWHVLADGDPAGQGYVGVANSFRGAEPLNNRATLLSRRDIEHVLWHNGFDGVYENAVLPQNKGLVHVAKGHVDYPTQTIKAAQASLRSKPALAYEVLEEMGRRGVQSVPNELQAMVQTVTALAGRAR
jgi:putative ATP-dependent endonuclease of OLD family